MASRAERDPTGWHGIARRDPRTGLGDGFYFPRDIHAVLQPLIPRALELVRERHGVLYPGQPFPDARLKAHLVELLSPVWDDVAQAIACFVHIVQRA